MKVKGLRDPIIEKGSQSQVNFSAAFLQTVGAHVPNQTETFKYISWIELGNRKISELCKILKILGVLDHNSAINTQTQLLIYALTPDSRRGIGVKRIIEYEYLLT